MKTNKKNAIPNLNLLFLFTCQTVFSVGIKTDKFEIKVHEKSKQLWSYSLVGTKEQMTLDAPVFEIGGKEIQAILENVTALASLPPLKNGVIEYKLEGQLKEMTDVKLTIVQ